MTNGGAAPGCRVRAGAAATAAPRRARARGTRSGRRASAYALCRVCGQRVALRAEEDPHRKRGDDPAVEAASAVDGVADAHQHAVRRTRRTPARPSSLVSVLVVAAGAGRRVDALDEGRAARTRSRGPRPRAGPGRRRRGRRAPGRGRRRARRSRRGAPRRCRVTTHLRARGGACRGSGVAWGRCCRSASRGCRRPRSSRGAAPRPRSAAASGSARAAAPAPATAARFSSLVTTSDSGEVCAGHPGVEHLVLDRARAGGRLATRQASRRAAVQSQRVIACGVADGVGGAHQRQPGVLDDVLGGLAVEPRRADDVPQHRAHRSRTRSSRAAVVVARRQRRNASVAAS